MGDSYYKVGDFGPKFYGPLDRDPWAEGARTGEKNPAYSGTVDHISDELIKQHVPWSTDVLDKEALKTGSSTLNLVAPRPVEEVNKTALSVIVSTIMLVDNQMHAPKWEDWYERKICGKKIEEWVQLVFKGSNAEPGFKIYAQETLKKNIKAQIKMVSIQSRDGNLNEFQFVRFKHLKRKIFRFRFIGIISIL
jgi:hypothetical protein